MAFEVSHPTAPAVQGQANPQPAAKRSRPTVGSALKKKEAPAPDYEKGVEYWNGIEASVDGVLGGFGEGPVPHIESLSSRLFILSLLPSLHTFVSPLTPAPQPRKTRLRALDVGAGIGRVTRDVLLPLFDDVILTEPVDKFVREARKQAEGWLDVKRGEKRVWIIKEGLQGFEPSNPGGAESLGVVGGDGKIFEGVYDVVWCQWCLGHTSHSELVDFLRRSKAALRDEESLIIVKENTCEDGPDGTAKEFLDEEDSSLTRSNGKWLEVFNDAGLKLVKEEVQVGMPEELFVVKTYALR